MPRYGFLFLAWAALALSGCDTLNKEEFAPTAPSPTFIHLAVSPTNAVHRTGVKQCYSATGGDGRYRWVLDNGTGPLEAGNEDRACYISTFPIKYTIVVYSNNQSATARGEVIK